METSICRGILVSLEDAYNVIRAHPEGICNSEIRKILNIDFIDVSKLIKRGMVRKSKSTIPIYYPVDPSKDYLTLDEKYFHGCK